MALKGQLSPEKTTRDVSHFGEMGLGVAGRCNEMNGRGAALETPKTTLALCLRDHPLKGLRLILHHSELLSVCYGKQLRSYN